MFRGESIEDYYRQAEATVNAEVRGQTDDYILGIDAVEYEEYLFNKHALSPVERNTNRDIETELVRQQRAYTDPFGDRVRGEVKVARIEYPIIPHRTAAKVLKLLPNSQRMVLPKFELRDDNIVMEADLPFLYGLGDTQSGRDEIGAAVTDFEWWLTSRNNDINRLNPPFREAIKQVIHARKEHVARTRSDFEAMIKQVGFPIKLKASAQARPVSLGPRKELQPILKPPTPKRPEEYVLKKEEVLAVVEVVQRWGRSLEATPQSVAGLEEEDIRSLILAQLNGVVDGAATGETFSKRGKSDIHLNLPKGDILVGECKIWTGAKAYGDAISQLFGYLTWRQNYGIIVTFVRNKEITKVLAEAQRAINEHPTFRHDLRQPNPSHFESQHVFLDDPKRTVEVHHLFFHFPPLP
jgi:hypothetical protein